MDKDACTSHTWSAASQQVGMPLALSTLLSVGTYSTRPTSAAVSSSHALSRSALANMTRAFTTADPDFGGTLNGQAHAAQGIPGVDSVPTFNGHFHLTGYTSAGTLQSDWYTNTVGHMPGDGGTTIGAPLTPVSVELLDANGNQAVDPTSQQPLYYDGTQFAGPALSSPIFQNASFPGSGTPTQYTDAIQRAEYYKQAPANWHTLLAPRLASARVLKVPYTVWHLSIGGKAYDTYYLNPDGTCCSDVFIPYSWFRTALKNNIVIPAIDDGSITQQDISSFLFGNVLPYQGTWPSVGIIGGYHSYLYERASAATNNMEVRWVYNFSTWYAADVLGYPDEDIHPLSHELIETLNDPYVGSDGVHDIVPVWTDGYSCSRRLEVADAFAPSPGHPIYYPILLNGRTWHPVNVALLQWFEGKNSDAIGGAYSYPDTTAMTSPMVPQNPNSCP